MELILDLSYKLKLVEMYQFLEPHEQEDGNRAVVEALKELPAGTPNEQRTIVASDARKKFIRNAEIANTMAARVSSFLVREAVGFKYRKDTPQGLRLEIPRKAENKTKPGVWYGQLVEQMEDYPLKLVLSAEIALWLYGVWTDDKVQNGFAPSVQTWVNVMDTEFERLHIELDAK